MTYEQLTLDDELEAIFDVPPKYRPHKVRGGGAYGITHDRDCPPCVAADQERANRRAAIKNPHRPGTKAHAKFERERYAGLNACDPRSETYWCM